MRFSQNAIKRAEIAMIVFLLKHTLREKHRAKNKYKQP